LSARTITTAAAHNADQPEQVHALLASSRHPGAQAPVPKPFRGKIWRRPILGSLINKYEAAA